MNGQLAQVVRQRPVSDSDCLLPAIIAEASDHASRSFLEFFTATIRNRNTRTAAIADDDDGPLFQTADRTRQLTERAVSRNDVLRVIKRRAKAAELPPPTCSHTFRATGITAYLSNGGSIEYAQKIAGHESPRTTKLYDRTDDAITLDEVERIAI